MLVLFFGFEDALEDRKGLTIFSVKLVVDCIIIQGQLWSLDTDYPVRIYLMGILDA